MTYYQTSLLIMVCFTIVFVIPTIAFLYMVYSEDDNNDCDGGTLP